MMYPTLNQATAQLDCWVHGLNWRPTLWNTLFLNFAETDAQNAPFFRDFEVLDDSKKYYPFPWNLEHTWLPLFMLSEGTFHSFLAKAGTKLL